MMKLFLKMVMLCVTVVIASTSTANAQYASPDPFASYTCHEMLVTLSCLQDVLNEKIQDVADLQSAIDQTENFILILNAQIAVYQMMGQLPPANLFAARAVATVNLNEMNAQMVGLVAEYESLQGVMIAWENRYYLECSGC